jgi:hypothetical protein
VGEDQHSKVPSQVERREQRRPQGLEARLQQVLGARPQREVRRPQGHGALGARLQQEVRRPQGHGALGARLQQEARRPQGHGVLQLRQNPRNPGHEVHNSWLAHHRW